MGQYTAEGYDKLYRETQKLWGIMLAACKEKLVVEWKHTLEWKMFVSARDVEHVYYDAWARKDYDSDDVDNIAGCDPDGKSVDTD